jgi:hypothetical protein
MMNDLFNNIIKYNSPTKKFEFNDIENYIHNYKIMHPNIYDFGLIFSSIIFLDNILCFIFGKKAQWFQLHCFVNILVTIDIMPTIIDLFTDPNTGYKLLLNNNASFYVICLHFYHVLIFKNLGFYDYFHHILFIGLGVVPSIKYITNNQLYLGYLACCGIPGVFEYGSLALYKNNKITLYTQKHINLLIYIWLRQPLCLFCITMNYVAYKNDLIKDNFLFTLYLNTLVFFNGSLFTYLTADSFFRIKYKPIELKKTE